MTGFTPTYDTADHLDPDALDSLWVRRAVRGRPLRRQDRGQTGGQTEGHDEALSIHTISC